MSQRDPSSQVGRSQVGPVPESPRVPDGRAPDEADTAEIAIPQDDQTLHDHGMTDHALRRAAEERRRAEQAVWLAAIPR
ncbi:hypothetical protein [Euzebya sp.]|uniref:hypothetical protein n=1 Tax=Euzebya sp. TaxID=1971409 RepID=UPI0035145B52